MNEKKTILVVDDDPSSRTLLEVYLEQQYNVLMAINGLEAIYMIENLHEKIDLVLLDLLMPSIDGLGVLEELNESGLIENVPVAVISSEGSEIMKNQAYLYNVYDFITKPFTYEEVMHTVNRILS